MAHRYPFHLFSIHPSLRFCVFGVWSRLQIFDFGTKKLSFVPTQSHKDIIRQVLFTKDGSQMVTFGDDKQVVLWSVDQENISFSPVASRPTHKKISKAMFYNDEHSKIMYCDKGGDVSILDAASEEKTAEVIVGHYAVLTDMALSQDQKLIATADRDEKIKISHFPKCFITKAFCHGHTQFVTNVSFLKSRLISAAGDATLRVWDPLTGSMLSTSKFTQTEHGSVNLELVPREFINDQYIHPDKIDQSAMVISKMVVSSSLGHVILTIEGQKAVFFFKYDDSDPVTPRFVPVQDPIQIPFEVLDIQFFESEGPLKNQIWITGGAPFLRVIQMDSSRDTPTYTLLESDPAITELCSILDSQGSYEDPNKAQTETAFSPTSMRKKHLVPPHLSQERKRKQRDGEKGASASDNDGEENEDD